ncbi:MAG: hypothetical protein KDK30_09965 [Leptospiraceae bacterium]|nr:hypothetical protein [Leptospiraceae bacterium]
MDWIQAWLPYFYQYGVGGFFFFLAIFVAYDRKVLNLSRKDDRRLLRGILIGFAFYLVMHGLWIASVMLLSD